VTSPPRQSSAANLGDHAAKERAQALVGMVLSGRYRIVELLAMGGVGAVYLGEHVKMHKHVAIKVLHPDAQGLPEIAARFEREAVAGAHIQHPNVAVATDFGELDDGTHFLVLEYVKGATLREVIRRGPLPVARAVSITKQIAAALGATHAAQIVHRDVKPRNVMLIEGERDVVKLIDFGLAKLSLKEVSAVAASRDSMSEHRITGTGAVFGTIAYLAPEATLGMDAVDARADLYALGLVFYEMLAGRHPFDTSDPVQLFKQHARTPPPPIAERAPGVIVPPPVEAVVQRLLAKSRDDRYPNAEAVIAALEAVEPFRREPSPRRAVWTRSRRDARQRRARKRRRRGGRGRARAWRDTAALRPEHDPVQALRRPRVHVELAPCEPPGAEPLFERAVRHAALGGGLDLAHELCRHRAQDEAVAREAVPRGRDAHHRRLLHRFAAGAALERPHAGVVEPAPVAAATDHDRIHVGVQLLQIPAEVGAGDLLGGERPALIRVLVVRGEAMAGEHHHEQVPRGWTRGLERLEDRGLRDGAPGPGRDELDRRAREPPLEERLELDGLRHHLLAAPRPMGPRGLGDGDQHASRPPAHSSVVRSGATACASGAPREPPAPPRKLR